MAESKSTDTVAGDDPTPVAATQALIKTFVAFKHGDEFAIGEALSISGEGMFLATDRPVDEGGLVELKFALPDADGHSSFVLLRAEVERLQADRSDPRISAGIGVRFLNTTDEIRDRIRRYVKEAAVQLVPPSEDAAQEHQSRDPADAQPVVGLEESSRYDLLSIIGAGGTSDVYKALDRELDEVIALKILKPEWSEDEDWVERLRQETKLSRRIKNEHVARIFEFGRLGNRHFLTMEFIPGVTVGRLIQERGPIPDADTIDYALQALEGIASAHDLGIVHRDIKPSNFMLTPENRIIVLDFGLARPPQVTSLTQRGELLGTPKYMSPEQIEVRPVGPLSDIYSFGCLLFEMLTGRVPFEGGGFMQIASRHLSEKPPSLRSLNPEVGPALEGVVLKCLAKQPEDRYPGARELAEALRQVQKATATAARAVEVRRRALVAEVEGAAYGVLERILREQGFDVERVTDGYRLVELALASPADVLFLSVTLPNIDGLEASQILRSAPATSSVPIVIVSGRNAHKELASFIPGARFLLRPFEEAAVVRCLRAFGLCDPA